jgi:CRISPR system Cascade subunit CasB
MTSKDPQPDAIYTWWHDNLADRNSGRARALAARLRRASDIGALCEPEVHVLAGSLTLSPKSAGRLSQLVRVLAEVRETDTHRLAQRLGGKDPVLSKLRFQRLMSSTGEEFVAGIRRTLPMVNRKAHVGWLGVDLLDLLDDDRPDRRDSIRIRWAFDYFGGAPAEDTDNQPETTALETMP